MLTVTLEGDADLARRLDGATAAARAAVADASAALADQLYALVEAKLSGEVLQSRTGALAASVEVEGPALADAGVLTSVSAGTRYAAIQEYGGVTAPHDILPSRARALAFVMGGRQVFAARVHHPGSHIPERSYLRASLAEMAPAIEAGMRAAVLGALRGTLGA
jgi:phage gpG-like protein